jgi:hypothetical protein
MSESQSKRTTNPIVRFDKRPTYLSAIKAMCAHCVGCTRQNLEPGFRDDIRDCTATECPLYMYRPFQRKEKIDAATHSA